MEKQPELHEEAMGSGTLVSDESNDLVVVVPANFSGRVVVIHQGQILLDSTLPIVGKKLGDDSGNPHQPPPPPPH